MQPSDSKIAQSIGRTIAHYRQQAGMTQAQVAEELGISNDAVSRMERGGILPSVIRLMQFAELFGCGIADLITQSSPNIDDQSKHLWQLLSQLDDDEREGLIKVIESMVEWHKSNS